MMIPPPAMAAPPSEAEMTAMGNLIADFRAEGVLIDTGGVSPDSLELTIRRSGGKITVTDGPFTEAKEVVGGYALMNVESRDHAIALTSRFLDLVGDATCSLHEVGGLEG